MKNQLLLFTLLLFSFTAAYAKKKEKEVSRQPGSPSIHIDSFHSQLGAPLGGVALDNGVQVFYSEQMEDKSWKVSSSTSSDLLFWEKKEMSNSPVILKSDSIDSDFKGCFFTDPRGGEENLLIAYFENPATVRVSKTNKNSTNWENVTGDFSFDLLAEKNISCFDVDYNEQSKSFILTTLDSEDNQLTFYQSNDGKNWTKTNEVSDDSKCFNLERINDEKWALFTGREYKIGSFTDGVFNTETDKKAFDHGRGVTKVSFIESSEQTVAFNFVNNGNTTKGGYIGGITYPKTITLEGEGESQFIRSNFANNCFSCFDEPIEKSEKVIYPGLRNKLLSSFRSETYLMEATFAIKTSDSFGMLVQGRKDKRGKEIAYLSKTNSIQTLAGTMPVVPKEGTIDTQILVDRNMVSVLIEDGKYSLTFYTHYDPDGKMIYFYSKGGECEVQDIKVYAEKIGK